jgi:hypothetical protein
MAAKMGTLKAEGGGEGDGVTRNFGVNDLIARIYRPPVTAPVRDKKLVLFSQPVEKRRKDFSRAEEAMQEHKWLALRIAVNLVIKIKVAYLYSRNGTPPAGRCDRRETLFGK